MKSFMIIANPKLPLNLWRGFAESQLAVIYPVFLLSTFFRHLEKDFMNVFAELILNS